MVRVAAASVALGLLAACAPAADPGGSGGAAPPPGDPRVDVDTPQLRKVKQRIGMDDCTPGTGEAVAGGLPSVTLACLGGGPDVDLASLRGPMVLNVWASWCGPCRREMPILQQFHEQYGERVAVLGIDWSDVRPPMAMDLVEETGTTYPSLADPGGEFAGVEGVGLIRGLPAWLLLDADGRVVHFEAVEVTSVAQVRTMAEEHLGVDL